MEGVGRQPREKETIFLMILSSEMSAGSGASVGECDTGMGLTGMHLRVLRG